VADSVLFTWVHNNTEGSLLLPLLFHTSIAVTGLFLASAESSSLVGMTLKWGVVTLVTMAYGSKYLSRQATAGA
jgi:hypothetical protein